MARISLPAELKRKQIAVRVGPEQRKNLEEAAKRNGRSIGAEIERRALFTLLLNESEMDLIIARVALSEAQAVLAEAEASVGAESMVGQIAMPSLASVSQSG